MSDSPAGKGDRDRTTKRRQAERNYQRIRWGRDTARGSTSDSSIIDTNTPAPYRTHTGRRAGEQNEGQEV